VKSWVAHVRPQPALLGGGCACQPRRSPGSSRRARSPHGAPAWPALCPVCHGPGACPSELALARSAVPLIVAPMAVPMGGPPVCTRDPSSQDLGHITGILPSIRSAFLWARAPSPGLDREKCGLLCSFSGALDYLSGQEVVSPVVKARWSAEHSLQCLQLARPSGMILPLSKIGSWPDPLQHGPLQKLVPSPVCAYHLTLLVSEELNSRSTISLERTPAAVGGSC